MALFGLLGGGGGGEEDDPYKDILTPAQRREMQSQGLLAWAAAMGEASQPSWLPVSLGSALGKAAGALGAGQQAGMTAALQNAQMAQKVRDLRSIAEFRSKFFGDQDTLNNLVKQVLGGGSATPSLRPPSTATPRAGTYVPPGAADDQPVMMDLEYPEKPGAGLLADPNAEFQYGADQPGTGLLRTTPPVRPQTAGLTGSAWELAANNLGGLRRPGVTATPSQGGFQTFDTPEAGLSAISRQLDRYASGATTGTPLTTIRQIVSTWAPPNENPTAALIQRAARVVGADPDQPLDLSDPSVKAKLIEATIRNEQGNRLPVDPALITRVASGGGGLLSGDQWLNQNAPFPTRANPQGQPVRYAAAAPAIDPTEPASLGPGSPYGRFPGDPTATGPTGPPDTVIPPARSEMGGARMMQAQYSPNTSEAGWGPTWPGGAGGPPLAPAAPAPGMSAVPLPPEVDPAKINALLLELARRNAGAEVLGMGNPYGSLLSVLQGSPQYKALIEQATRGAGLPFIRQEAEEKGAGELPSKIVQDRAKAQLDQVNKRVEQMGAAALEPATIPVADGKGGIVEKQGTRYQQMLAANGFSVPELGIKGMYPAPAPGELPNIPGFTPPGASQARPTPAPQAQAEPSGVPAAGTPAGKPVRSPGETKSEEVGVAAGWEALKDTHAAELAAGRSDQQLGQIAEAMQGFVPGATAPARIKGEAILRDLGWIKGDEVPSAETFQRNVRQLQLAAGAQTKGSVSNYERDLIAEGALQMSNTPEGIAKAVAMMQRLNAYDRAVAKIHRDVAKENRGVPNVLEAQQRIAALGPPLSPGEISALETIRAGRVPGMAPPVPDVGTVRDGHRFKGGNPAEPANWEKM